MTTMCLHTFDSFNYNPFGENKEPTDDEITIYRLWKCATCNKWYSLIGVTKGE